MDRKEALRLLSEDRRPLPDNQEFTAGFFEPSDARGVTRLVYAVYGDGYPVDTFYIPERLVEEHASGNIKSVVARTSSGDVIAHIALYRSSSPNPEMYELGLGIVLPSYRHTTAFYRVSQMCLSQTGKDGVHAVFGEPVCNHVTTQKMCMQLKMPETAIEPSLMPARAYETEKSSEGRVSCFITARVDLDARRRLYIPEAYAENLDFMMQGLGLDREMISSEEKMPGDACEIRIDRFEYANVARCSIVKPGHDFSEKAAEILKNLQETGYFLVEFFIDLGKPWAGDAVNILGKKGCFIGGFLPVWFGDDGFLMHRIFGDPGFEDMKIHTGRGKRIQEMVIEDWKKSIKTTG